MIAWQRPTLAERKSATIGAKELSLLVNGGHYLSQLCSFLTYSLTSSKLVTFFACFVDSELIYFE